MDVFWRRAVFSNLECSGGYKCHGYKITDIVMAIRQEYKDNHIGGINVTKNYNIMSAVAKPTLVYCTYNNGSGMFDNHKYNRYIDIVKSIHI